MYIFCKICKHFNLRFYSICTYTSPFLPHILVAVHRNYVFRCLNIVMPWTRMNMATVLGIVRDLLIYFIICNFDAQFPNFAFANIRDIGIIIYVLFLVSRHFLCDGWSVCTFLSYEQTTFIGKKKLKNKNPKSKLGKNIYEKERDGYNQPKVVPNTKVMNAD